MNFSLRHVALLTLGLATLLTGRAQTPAPATLPGCIVKYTHAGYPLSAYLHRTVLYRPDGTYIEWSVVYSASAQPPGATRAPHSGTFVYAVDPQNPANASIVYDGGTGSVSTDTLSFRTATAGSCQSTPYATAALTNFFLYPQHPLTGGTNLSARSSLAPGDTPISGFVIASGGPRWVLLRAVGVSLQHYGVSPTVTGPTFTLHNTSAVVANSAVWSADPNLTDGYKSAFSVVGASPLDAGSDESVLLLPLDPGAYTIVASAQSAGEILCEVYLLPF